MIYQRDWESMSWMEREVAAEEEEAEEEEQQ